MCIKACWVSQGDVTTNILRHYTTKPRPVNRGHQLNLKLVEVACSRARHIRDNSDEFRGKFQRHLGMYVVVS